MKQSKTKLPACRVSCICKYLSKYLVKYFFPVVMDPAPFDMIILL